MSDASENLSLEPEDTEKYLKSLMLRWEADSIKQRKHARVQGVLSICVLLLSGVGFYVGLSLLNEHLFLIGLPLITSCGVFFLIAASSFLKYRENFLGRATLLEEMHKLNDIRTLPYLLQAYEQFEGKNDANTAALTLLLLKLQPQDSSFAKPYLNTMAGFLKISQLREIGAYPARMRLVLAAISAIKNVSDAEMIPVIEKVVDLRAWMDDGERVVRFAQDCLQTLRLRAAQTAVSHTLLRPADSQGEESELLRAAKEAEHNPDELLRISSSELV